MPTVTKEQLEELAAEYQEPGGDGKHTPPPGGGGNGHPRLLVERFLQDRGLGYTRKPTPDAKGRTVWVLKECPFNPDHGATKEVAVMQWPSGKMCFLCMHNGCSGKGWQDFREAVGKPEARHYDQPFPGAAKPDAKPAGKAAGSPAFTGPPRPVRVSLLPVPRLDRDMLPGPLGDWLADIADRGCFPPEFPAAAAVVSVSSLVGRKAAVRPKRHDDWEVVPNLWGAIVGQPGIQKSPAVAEAMRPLNRLAAEAITDHADQKQEFETRALVARAKAKAAQSALEKAAKEMKKPAPKKGASPSLEDLAAEARAGAEEDPPVMKRYVVNDTTVEKLGELLKENPDGLLVFRDELTGFLRTLDRQGHESDRAFYLEAWDGRNSFAYDRIGRGTVIIPTVCLSIFGTIQPGPLARYLRASAAENDGLVNRFQLLLYPDPPARWVNVDQWPDTTAKARAWNVFQSLDQLAPLALGAEQREDEIPYFRFAPDAQEFFDAWRTGLENRLRSGEDSPLVQSHLAKYRSLLPSLALLFHLVELVAGVAGKGPVSLRCTVMAERWCRFLEAHARRIYQAAFDGDPEPALRLAERIKNSLPNPFTVRVVQQKCWSGLDSREEIEKAVNLLVDFGWLQSQDVPPTSAGGRPSTCYWIHPNLLAGDPP